MSQAPETLPGSGAGACDDWLNPPADHNRNPIPGAPLPAPKFATGPDLAGPWPFCRRQPWIPTAQRLARLFPEFEKSIAAPPELAAAHHDFSEGCELVQWGFVPRPIARRIVGAWVLSIGVENCAGQRIFAPKHLFMGLWLASTKTFAYPLCHWHPLLALFTGFLSDTN